MPTTVPYVQFLWQLQQQLGVEKLREAIALIPNNPNRLNVPLASDLKVLDAFYAHPQAFEPLPDSALDWDQKFSIRTAKEALFALKNNSTATRQTISTEKDWQYSKPLNAIWHK